MKIGQFGLAGPPAFSIDGPRTGGRVVEGARLESA